MDTRKVQMEKTFKHINRQEALEILKINKKRKKKRIGKLNGHKKIYEEATKRIKYEYEEIIQRIKAN